MKVTSSKRHTIIMKKKFIIPPPLKPGEEKVYVQNPYFDDVFGDLLNIPIPTKQIRDKTRLRKFREAVTKTLNEYKDKDKVWPRKRTPITCSDCFSSGGLY